MEVLVAADVVHTITIDPSIESVGVLGVLVLVLIAFSFSIDIEVDGILPWRRAETEAALAARSDTADEGTG